MNLPKAEILRACTVKGVYLAFIATDLPLLVLLSSLSFTPTPAESTKNENKKKPATPALSHRRESGLSE